MLSQAIGALLPSAVGVALSPIPIIAIILMLGTPNAKRNGSAFAIGWVAGLLVVSLIVFTAASGANESGSTAESGVNWLQVGIGVLFIAMARRQWSGRPKKGELAEMPAWMDSVDHFTAGRSLLLGGALSGVNPKNLALTAAAAASIAQSGVEGIESIEAIAVFVILGSLTVVGPVVYFLIAPERAAASLVPVKEFMSEHNAVIMMVILLVLGAKLLGEGFAGVAN